MRRVLNTIEEYYALLNEGRISKHDEVFIKDGALCCEGVIVESNKNGIKNGDNTDSVTIRTDEEITLRSGTKVVIGAQDYNIEMDPSGNIEANCSEFLINNKPIHANEYYSEWQTVEDNDEGTKIIAISEFSTKYAKLTNVIQFVPIDTQYLSANNLSFVKFITEITKQGLKEGKAMADEIKNGYEKSFTYSSAAEATTSMRYADEYAINTFDWRPGVKLIQVGSGSGVDEFKLLCDGKEVATKSDLEQNYYTKEEVEQLIAQAIANLNN